LVLRWPAARAERLPKCNIGKNAQKGFGCHAARIFLMKVENRATPIAAIKRRQSVRGRGSERKLHTGGG